MPTYIGFHALGSIVGGGAKGAVHGVSLGSQAATPSSISHTIKNAEILGFEYGMETPRDSGSGEATGRRPHKSITVTKETDQSSPLLFQACVTNELLRMVNLNFYTSSARSGSRPSFTITLTNAVLTAIHHVPLHSSTPKHTSTPNTHELEQVSFAFEKIDIDNVDSKKTAKDDWTA